MAGQEKPEGTRRERAAAIGVDGHAHERVDERDGVRTGGLGGAGDLGDIGDVGRELDDERAGSGLAAHAHHLLDGLHVRADGHAAGIDVRARDVDLVRVDGCVFKRLDDLHVLVEAMTGNVDDGSCAGLGKPRQLAGLQMLDAGVLQADGVEHTRRNLCDARGGIALPAIERDALGGDGAQG